MPNDDSRDPVSGLPLEHRRPCPRCGRVAGFVAALPVAGELCGGCVERARRGLRGWRTPTRRVEGGEAAERRYHGSGDPDAGG